MNADARQADPSPMDRLIGGTRVLGASRVIRDGTDPAGVSPEQARAVVAHVVAYRKQKRLEVSSIARSAGHAVADVRVFLNGTFAGNWQDVAVDLDRWLETVLKQDAAPKDGEFVRTRVAQEIFTVADAAATLRTIGLVYGPTTSGTGKTMALNAIAAERPGALLVTINKVASNATGVLHGLMGALGKGITGSNAYMFNIARQALRDAPRLLMVDQIHNLCGAKGDKPLYVLADLFDATGAPQLWCGTSDIVSYLNRGEKRGEEPLAQIRRRIGIWRDLTERRRRGGGGGPDGGEPLHSIDEVRAIFGRGKMRLAADAASYLYELANVPNEGALGTCRNVVRMALLANGDDASVLTAAMLRSAHRTLMNGPAYRAIEQEMRETVKVMAKVG